MNFAGNGFGGAINPGEEALANPEFSPLGVDVNTEDPLLLPLPVTGDWSAEDPLPKLLLVCVSSGLFKYLVPFEPAAPTGESVAGTIELEDVVLLLKLPPLPTLLLPLLPFPLTLDLKASRLEVPLLR